MRRADSGRAGVGRRMGGREARIVLRRCIHMVLTCVDVSTTYKTPSQSRAGGPGCLKESRSGEWAAVTVRMRWAPEQVLDRRKTQKNTFGKR